MNQDQLQLRDIHPPLLLPEDPNYALFAAGLVGFLVVAALLFWFFRLRKKPVILPFAHETALTDLRQARSEMNAGQALLYAQEVSDLLRRYIEKRFHIQSTRQTTKEFFSYLTGNLGITQITFSEKHRNDLRECLRQCDMAKFARCTPDQNSMEKMESAIQNFIESTRENREGGK